MAQASAILTLIRHGETSANTDHVWHGSTDSPLTERGRAQAECVARYAAENLKTSATALYASPLQRARGTAAAIGRALDLPIREEPGLQEYDLGSWEGRSYSELHQIERFWDKMREDPDFAPHGGESPRQVVERFVGALRAIALRHSGERAVVVTHGAALSMALGALLEGDYSNWSRVIDNCAVSELVLEPAPSLLLFNHVDHLTDFGLHARANS
jgi:broad specificity phosphatase PhoE